MSVSMLVGALILLCGGALGYYISTLMGKQIKQVASQVDPYEKYRNKDGLLSSKATKRDN